jgi:tetratricopeptide (TPR) repeat protein
MPAEDIRRISLIWRLNRNDFTEDVRDGENLFHRAAFITQNRSDLADRPEALCLLARIYLALEEYAEAVHCMEELSQVFPEDLLAREFLESPVSCFKLTSETAQPRFKVVFHCQGSIDGKPVPSTFGRFQEAVVGDGFLLPEFEEQLCGMKAGSNGRFDVAFPDQYGQPALAGKGVAFQVHLHWVLKPMTVEGFQDLDAERLFNDYPPGDLADMRQHNINLYYRVLAGCARRGEPMDVADALMLTNLSLKLGLLNWAWSMTEKLSENPVVFTHAAHVFRTNGQPERALSLLDSAKQEGPREGLIRAQALLDLDRLEEAEAAAADLRLPGNVQLAELRVRLAARLCLPLDAYLERQDALLDAKTQAMLQTG